MNNNCLNTLDIDTWEQILNRKLNIEEKKIILNVILEDDLNLQIKNLQNNMISNGLFFIPFLTNSKGNCLFESLSYLEIGNTTEIRRNIAALLLLVRNDKTFFPNLDISPEQIFLNANDLKYVYIRNEDKSYSYNYDMMIVDLYNNNNWSRLPTELILMAMSRIYEIKINIHHNKSTYISTVNVWNGIILNDEITQIHLGHINEEHYVPIIKIPDEILDNPELYYEYIYNPPKYNIAINKYNNWAEKIVMFDDKNLTNLTNKSIYNYDLDVVYDLDDNIDNYKIIT